MDNYQLIANHFHGTVEAVTMSVDDLATPVEAASLLMLDSLLQDGKIFTCGSGVDGALAQILTAKLLARHENERPALPAVALSADCTSMAAIARSNGVNDIYARQLRALGQPGDILICINSAESSANLLRAVQGAKERNMHVIALSNAQDREMLTLMTDSDVAISIHATHGSTVVELQLMVIHCLCSLVDNGLFGSHD